MKKIITILVMILTLVPAIYAHAEEGHGDFSEALEIIENEIPCKDLNDEQFELLGDYYMEQMHPGEVHERMDNAMGGEGSESLRTIHINMGKSIYCEGSSMGMMHGTMSGSGHWPSGVISLFYVVLLIGIIILIYIALKERKGKKRRHRK